MMYASQIINQPNDDAATKNGKGKPHSRLFKRLISCQPSFSLHFKDSIERKSVEQYIHDKYHHVYQADIHQFMPCLMSMANKAGVSSVLGIRSAANETLFVEQYSQLAIEQEIEKHCGFSIDRNKIAEVGNLAAVKRGSSSLLIIMATALLYHSGYHWGVFTATKNVRHITDKLDGKTYRLCEANANQLQGNAEHWGDYYETKPYLIAGDIRDNYKRLQQHRLYRIALRYFENNILALSQEFARH